MDVEINPGPGPDHSYTAIVQHVQSSMERRFSQIMNGLQRLAADIGQKMDENLGRLDYTLGQLIEDIFGQRKEVQQDKEDIRKLRENADNVKHRLDRLQQELDSLEAISKQCNLKFLGVPERGRESYRTCVERIVDILNEYSSSRTWKNSDIETAYRIGDRRKRSDQPRPLIVTFHGWSDKMEVFDNTVARDLLRRDGIRVSSELTTRQRDEVRHYRRQGKVAFYKNGRLQVEKRQANPARDSRRSNGQRYINDDQDEGERMYHYYKRRSAQTSDSRQSSYYEERRTDQCHSSRFGGSKGDSLYRSGEKERRGP